MSNDKDKWSEKFRNKMQDYEEPVSDNLWESIENDLPGKPKRPFFIYLTRVAAVAACIGLAVWGYSLFNDENVNQTPIETLAESTDIKTEVEKTDNAPQQIMASDLLESRKESIAQNAPQQRSVAEPAQQEEVIAVASMTEEETMPAVEETKEETPQEPTWKEEQEEKPFTLFENDNTYSKQPSRQGRKYQRQAKPVDTKWGFALAVNGGSNQGSTSGNGFSPLRNKYSLGAHKVGNTAENKFIREYQNILLSNLSKATRTNVKYDFPLTYSAMFKYRINNRWGINAGLNFTQYSSEWESGTERDYYVSQQKAYFIGVPVNVNFTIFDSRYFSLYALAGGSVEKSVGGSVRNTIVSNKNKLEQPSVKEGLESHPWQYSLNAGVGLQFNINKNYGIFAEPQVAKFFDNGDLNIRKQDKAEFRLNVGLRFSY